MGVVEPLQKLQLVVDHLLVSLDVFLEDDFDCYLAGRAVRFADYAIGPCTLFCSTSAKFPISRTVVYRHRLPYQCATHLIQGPTDISMPVAMSRTEGSLLVVSSRLAMEFIENGRD